MTAEETESLSGTLSGPAPGDPESPAGGGGAPLRRADRGAPIAAAPGGAQ